jgi:hypothetical protein
VPIKKLRASLCAQGIRLYLSDGGAVRIETSHYHCEMKPEEFLLLLRKAARRTTRPQRSFFVHTEWQDRGADLQGVCK